LKPIEAMIRHKKVVEILIRRALSFMKAARCGTNKIRKGERLDCIICWG